MSEIDRPTSAQRKPTIVLINGSMHGDSDQSNTLRILQFVEAELLHQGARPILISPSKVRISLPGSGTKQTIYVFETKTLIETLEGADGIIIGTGVHWGQSSSVLQKFIEDATPTESGTAWFKKPVGIIVSEHSTGGQMVLANLMLTLNNYGCTIPPQAGMVFSRTGQSAREQGEDWAQDVWGPSDIKAIVNSVLGINLRPWPVDDDPGSFHSRWVHLPGSAIGKDKNSS